MLRSTFVVVLAVALVGATRKPRDDQPYREVGTLARAIHHIERNYVDEVDLRALVHGAIRGMMTVLDKRSRFHDPEEVVALRRRWDELTSGVGIELAADGDGVAVASVISGSPAAKRLIRPGDRVLEVDGQRLAGAALEDAERRLRGAAGSYVRLVVDRAGDAGPEQISLERAPQPERTVESKTLDGGIIYVRIRRFGPKTAEEVKRALGPIETKTGLIIDLRDNQGGVFEEAVRLADHFLAKGVIVSTISRRQKARTERARPKGAWIAAPIAILVNGRTASAAEVLAAGLADNDRATLVGTHTYGKGTVQTLIELEDGSALTLTVAEYRTPSGRSLDGLGIRPNVLVPPSYDPDQPATDVQLAAAISYLNGSSRGG